LNDCLEGKIKKQNMDRIVLDLINLLIHNTSKNRYVSFEYFVHILEHTSNKGFK
jgi:hypothetical protein